MVVVTLTHVYAILIRWLGDPDKRLPRPDWVPSLSCVSQYDITVWVPGHPIIGIIRQDVMCLGSDCANLRVLSQYQFTAQTKLRRKYPLCQGSVGCATSIQEFLSCFQKGCTTLWFRLQLRQQSDE